MTYPFHKSISPDAVTSSYEAHVKGIGRAKSKLPGTDYGIPCGRPIYAPGDGELGDYIDGNGTIYAVWISPDKSQRWDFLHVSEVKVERKKWRKVKEGEIIGITGKTGKATGCHVHLTIRHRDKAGRYSIYKDPYPIIKSIWIEGQQKEPTELDVARSEVVRLTTLIKDLEYQIGLKNAEVAQLRSEAIVTKETQQISKLILDIIKKLWKH